MFRFAIRDVLWLMVVVGMGVALVVEVHGRRNYQLTTSRWASVEEQEWAKERFTAAKAEFQQTERYWRGPGSGQWPFYETCSAIERYAQAAEELPADAKTRAKELEAALSFAKFFESMTQNKFEQGSEPQHRLNRTQFTRAEVETRLKRVEREIVLQDTRK